MTVDSSTAAVPRRQVGFLLGVGITFLPIVFVWLLLKPGYSVLARVIGFAWLALGILFLIGSAGNDGASTAASDTSSVETLNTGPAMTPLRTPLSIGDAQITVTSVETRDQVGIQYASERASEGGVLVVVDYTLKNTGAKPLKAYQQPKLELMDSSGVVYEEDAGKAAAYAMEGDNDAKLWSDLNPGITTRDSTVFEVAREGFDASKWVLIADGKSRRLALQ